MTAPTPPSHPTTRPGMPAAPAEPTPPDLDAIRTDLHTYTAIMREPDVPYRQADNAAHRLAAHLPALLAEVQRLRVLAAHQADDASDYQLVSDEIAARLIGDGWDDDAAEVAIVIAWAQHMARVHPDCSGRFCDVTQRRPGRWRALGVATIRVAGYAGYLAAFHSTQLLLRTVRMCLRVLGAVLRIGRRRAERRTQALAARLTPAALAPPAGGKAAGNG